MNMCQVEINSAYECREKFCFFFKTTKLVLLIVEKKSLKIISIKVVVILLYLKVHYERSKNVVPLI